MFLNGPDGRPVQSAVEKEMAGPRKCDCVTGNQTAGQVNILAPFEPTLYVDERGIEVGSQAAQEQSASCTSAIVNTQRINCARYKSRNRSLPARWGCSSTRELTVSAVSIASIIAAP